MKKVYFRSKIAALVLGLGLFSAGAGAQSFKVQGSKYVKITIADAANHEYPIKMENISGKKLELKWAVSVLGVDTDKYVLGICDNNTCYSFDILPKDPMNPVDFGSIAAASGSTGAFLFDLQQKKADNVTRYVKVLVSDPSSGQSDTLTWEINPMTVGIKDQTLPAAAINVFPNPAADQVTISVENPVAGKASLTLYSIQGQPVGNLTITASGQYKMNTSDLAPGMYLLRYRDEKGNVLSRTITKQ